VAKKTMEMRMKICKEMENKKWKENT